MSSFLISFKSYNVVYPIRIERREVYESHVKKLEGSYDAVEKIALTFAYRKNISPSS